MNNKTKAFLKNFSYTLTSNLITLMVSVLVIFIVPKFLGAEEYGYWQIYLFYSTYVGFLHFGWNDGVYLRYGGKQYKELDKTLFFTQFYMLTLLQFLIGLIIVILTFILPLSIDKAFIFKMISINLIVVNVRNFLFFILQGTNRIKEYARSLMVDRILYICLVVIILAVGIRDYKFLVQGDLIGKTISLVYVMFYCKEIIIRNISAFYFSFKEALENIRVGIKLMFANVANLLIVGFIRLGIERSWDVSTFGKVSLTLSVANLMMLFINALGIIFFPILRRTKEDRLKSIYLTSRDLLMAVLFGCLILYYPLEMALSQWLPQYADGLIYMAILFPISIYEGKMILLINTYLKTLRKENLILSVNLVSVVISMVSTFITTILLRNLDIAVLSIVIILAFRSIFAEIVTANILGISIYKDIILEILLTVVFIFIGLHFESWFALCLYTLSYLIYLVIKRKDINISVNKIRELIST